MTVNALNKGVTIGDWTLQNTGQYPVVIQKIALIDPAPGLKVISFSLASNNTHSVGTAQVYPPPGLKLLSIHTPIRPSAALGAAELIGGFSIPHDGRFAAKGVLVTYTEGGHTYQMIVNEGIAFCYPLEKYPNAKGGCPLPSPNMHPTAG